MDIESLEKENDGNIAAMSERVGLLRNVSRVYNSDIAFQVQIDLDFFLKYLLNGV